MYMYIYTYIYLLRCNFIRLNNAMISPRQARDKHRERSTQNEVRGFRRA